MLPKGWSQPSGAWGAFHRVCAAALEPKLRDLQAAAAEGRVAATVVSKAEAQELLVSKGFEPLRAESFVESFEGQISVRETQAGERFLRYTDNP